MLVSCEFSEQLILLSNRKQLLLKNFAIYGGQKTVFELMGCIQPGMSYLELTIANLE